VDDPEALAHTGSAVELPVLVKPHTLGQLSRPFEAVLIRKIQRNVRAREDENRQSYQN
jgi:hypothetical protein